MNREKIFRVLTFFFMVLTFAGATYVLINDGQKNAGFAVVPGVFCVAFSQLGLTEKKKNKKL